MKLVIDERLKHRIVGVIVLVAVGVVFLPAIMKKSNYSFDENVNLSVRLPTKPALPNVAMASEKVMFQSVKVARVEIPVTDTQTPASQLVKADPISPIPTLVKEPILAKELVTEPVINRVAASKNVALAKHIAAAPSKTKKDIFAVQLASFTQQKNAQSLVTKLRGQGYKASYIKLSNKQGDLYKVIVGEVTKRVEAVNLQTQLASKTQLTGFIIKTGVS